MLENIRISFQGIWAHKMRSFLTMLGIIIGIASIIAIVSTIKGTNEQIKQNLVGSGDNIVEVKLYQGEWEYTSGDSQKPENAPVITDEIREEILDLDEVTDMCAYRKGLLWNGLRYKDKSLEGTVLVGVDDHYFSVMGYELTNGRIFTDTDRKINGKYVIVDTTVVSNVFNGENPVGKTIELAGQPYVVIGVVQKQNEFKPTVENVNDWYTYYQNSASGQIFLPDNIWPMVFDFDEPYNVAIRAKNTDAMTKGGRGTADILNKYIQNDDSEDNGSKLAYRSADLLQTAKELQDVSNSTSKQLIWIASISLLVGGIGVMNIMLVSVTERTREIGLKKALGARNSVILGQFLTEAAVLTCLGGILGVGAGIGFSYIVSKVAEVPVAISGGAIVISVVFSVVIGVVFGLLPSVKAAKLNPIDALIYE